ncbi:hypothetical protein [Natronomonas sp. EA1]|uniref:hypothetical protein n=1 Tax=Natronomonas sp. EA1 TaxID=3421655 RepID=UPI003EB824AF
MGDATIGNPDSGLMRWLDAETVAEAGYQGVMNGKPVVVPGIEYKLLSVVTRLLPRGVVRKVAGAINR